MSGLNDSNSAKSDKKIDRRTLLASAGLVGAALATGGLLGEIAGASSRTGNSSKESTIGHDDKLVELDSIDKIGRRYNLNDASNLGASDPNGELITIQQGLEESNQEYHVSAYSQHVGGMQTGPMIVQLSRKLRITGDQADAAYNNSVLSEVLAGLPNGSEVEFPARGLAYAEGGLLVDAYGVSFRGHNPSSYDGFWLKFKDSTENAFTIAKPGFHVSNLVLAGASNPSSGFGNDVAHDCFHFKMSGVDCDATITDSTIAFFRDCVTIKEAVARNIKFNNVLFSGSSRAFSYTHLGDARARGFEFYDCRYHGIGREAHARSAVIYADPASNVRGITVSGGLADSCAELMRGYASGTNISNVPMETAERGYISLDFGSHTHGLPNRGVNILNGSYQMYGGRTLPSNAVSLAGAGYYVVDGFVSYGSAGHGIFIDSLETVISNTLVHNAGQLSGNTYSGYFIGANSRRVTFNGIVEYCQDVKGSVPNKAKYAFENKGKNTTFTSRPMVYGMASGAEYFVDPAVTSYGFDPSAQPSRLSYGIAAPTAGTWTAGDRIVRTPPVAGEPKGWVCTVSGTPGTWVSEGNL